MGEGIKHDQDKLPYHLFAPEALEGTLKVLAFGANKYAERNWEKGLHFSRVFGALMRHMWAWWRGETLDPETELNHLHHAACCIHFLQTYTERGMENFDDRPRALQKGVVFNTPESIFPEKLTAGVITRTYAHSQKVDP